MDADASSGRVATPPEEKPLMVYDGDCPFCVRWARRWQAVTGSRVGYMPSRQASTRFPDIPLKQLANAVQLIDPDGRVFEGAAAIFRSLSFLAVGRGLIWAYRRLPGFAALADGCYRWVARHRHTCPTGAGSC